MGSLLLGQSIFLPAFAEVMAKSPLTYAGFTQTSIVSGVVGSSFFEVITGLRGNNNSGF